MSRAGGSSDPAARSQKHFDRAVELSGSKMAGPFVSFAESVCVQRQDVTEFKSLLEHALSIDADEKPEWRLANLVLQRRARWLLAHTDDLFLNADQQQKEKP
jgi:predicted anti-sigma-YlaC factor YlaD